MNGFLIAVLGGLHIAFRLKKIIRVIPLIQFVRIPMAPSFLIGLINLEGDTIPVINLYQKFGFDLPEFNALQRLVIIKVKETQFAILVEEAEDLVEASEKQIINPDNVFKGLGNLLENVIQINDKTIPVFELSRLINELEYGLVKELLEKTISE